MRNATIRWTIYLFALFIAGPIAGMLVSMARSADGGVGSPLVSTSPALGLIAAIGALAIALVIGLVTARVLGLAPALTASGLVVAWAAWRTADTDQLIRTAHSGSPLVMLAVEGVIFGFLGLGIAVACWLTSKKETARPIEAGSGGHAFGAVMKTVFSGKAGFMAVIAGLVAGGVAAWLIAASPLKGQAVFAAIAAGTFAAAACRLADYESPIPVMFLPLILLAMLGPLSGLAMAGSGGVVASTYKGALFPLANISGLDWVAGALLGIPLGVSWAGSMIEKRVQEA